MQNVLCIDATSIYDAIARRSQPIRLTEKAAAIEMLAFLNARKKTGKRCAGCTVKRTPRIGAHEQFVLFAQSNCTWPNVYDENTLSAKKRRKAGLNRFGGTDLSADFHDNRAAMKERWPSTMSDIGSEQWLAPYPRNC